MLIPRLHRFLTAPIAETAAPNHSRTATPTFIFWLSLSLTFAAIYGLIGLHKAFRAEYIVAKDAREYVFWMQRFIDPELLPHDLIADYFKSITPSGYAAVYHLMASVGINPLLLSKILPIVLALVTTCYCFGVCLQLLPVPAAGFIATLLLNQSLWFRDDLASATPRAFVYPLLLAFFYYLLRRSVLAVGVAIALQGLFYPPLVFISVGILFVRLWNWQLWPPHLERNRFNYFLFVLGLGIAFLLLFPYAMSTSEFGPLVNATEARNMPEFWPGGRHPYFDPNPWKFWLVGQHSGAIPPLLPPLIWIGLLLPVVLRNPSRFPLVKQIKSSVTLLPQIVLVSLGLFFAAHALLLKLFFPSRYTSHTFRIVMALAAGIVLTVMLDAVLQTAKQLIKPRWSPNLNWRQPLQFRQVISSRQQFVIGASTVVVGAILFLYPNFAPGFPLTNYRVSGESGLYEFFQKQSKDILIATLSDEANDIPTFAQRSILVGKEYALPFHLGYYRQIRQRAIDLIHAQYSQDLAEAESVIQKYGIDFWLLDRAAFTPDYLTNSWFTQYHTATHEALKTIEQGTVPALSRLTERCSVFEDELLIVLPAKCIANRAVGSK
ncbi:MAG: hypothetical protein JOZ78_04005 [Chroococcidiopsidaceae cyanobacterium CP_BM_ER_R8_30]|nr:hypothetical protein [Chroococcidiopsidaceae cyanobacterium CP_BM_ER_R8_30]